MTELPTVMIHSDDPEPVARLVRGANPGLKVEVCDSYSGLATALASSGASIVYSVRFAGTLGFPRAALVENPSVAWVSVAGSGIDHLAPWDPKNVTVTNAAGVAADMMAEYAMAATLYFSVGFHRFRAAQERHEWIAGTVAPIAGRTALVVGLGHTGRAAAQRFKDMGMAVLGLRTRPQPTPNVDEVHGVQALHDLLPRADVILVCVPLLPTTRGLFNAAAFDRAKPGAILIDVSRGGVVVQSALVAAMSKGRLAGAVLDVFETEPLPTDSPLWDLPNVMVTPHCSSVYDGWQAKSVELFCENLSCYLRGAPLANAVDPTRGY